MSSESRVLSSSRCCFVTSWLRMLTRPRSRTKMSDLRSVQSSGTSTIGASMSTNRSTDLCLEMACSRPMRVLLASSWKRDSVAETKESTACLLRPPTKYSVSPSKACMSRTTSSGFICRRSSYSASRFVGSWSHVSLKSSPSWPSPSFGLTSVGMCERGTRDCRRKRSASSTSTLTVFGRLKMPTHRPTNWSCSTFCRYSLARLNDPEPSSKDSWKSFVLGGRSRSEGAGIDSS